MREDIQFNSWVQVMDPCNHKSQSISFSFTLPIPNNLMEKDIQSLYRKADQLPEKRSGTETSQIGIAIKNFFRMMKFAPKYSRRCPEDPAIQGATYCHTVGSISLTDDEI